ncbi:hypothetical protein Dimus_038164 [Dionaea muscipula]
MFGCWGFFGWPPMAVVRLMAAEVVAGRRPPVADRPGSLSPTIPDAGEAADARPGVLMVEMGGFGGSWRPAGGGVVARFLGGCWRCLRAAGAGFRASPVTGP